jgi:hypothetical protein
MDFTSFFSVSVDSSLPSAFGSPTGPPVGRAHPALKSSGISNLLSMAFKKMHLDFGRISICFCRSLKSKIVNPKSKIVNPKSKIP